MKLKRAILCLGAVCILNTIVAGCSSPGAKEQAISKEANSRPDADKDESVQTTATEPKTTKPKATKPKATKPPQISLNDGERAICDPMAGIVEAYDGSTMTIKDPDDNMIYYFFTEDAPILEGYSTEDAQEVEGGIQIAVGDKVEVSYQGLLNGKERPTKAVKIVVIKTE